MDDNEPDSPDSWLSRVIKRFKPHQIESKQDLHDAMTEAEDKQLIDADAARMIDGVLRISKMTVKDIMIPRAQMVTLERGKHLSSLLPTIIESTHSRFPVIEEGDRDSVVGILLAKDLLKYYARHEFEDQMLEEHFLRPAVFVPESKRIDSLLKEFRLSHNHLAIVVDEYNAVSGVVTIEDVLEQIVGDIEDEYDGDEEIHICPLDGNRFRVDAQTFIEDFNERFECSISDDRVDTIGGLVMQHLGYVPKVGETTSIGSFDFEVTQADDRHILECIVTPNDK